MTKGAGHADQPIAPAIDGRVWPLRRRSAPAGTFDADTVLARLVEWAAEHGGPPRAYDWNPPMARAMGLPTAGCDRWEREHPRWPGHATVVRYFGTWAQALHAAGLALPPPERDLSLSERVQAARRLRVDGLTKREIADVLGVSVRTVGNYLAAQPCLRCAQPVVKSGSGLCRGCVIAARPPAPWTQSAVLAALRRWEQQTGAQPTPSDWGDRRAARDRWHREQPAWPSYGQVVRLFGGWRAMLEAGGRAPLTRAWSGEEIVHALRRHARAHGRLPTARQWTRRGPDHPPASTVVLRFGSWSAALHAAAADSSDPET